MRPMGKGTSAAKTTMLAVDTPRMLPKGNMGTPYLFRDA